MKGRGGREGEARKAECLKREREDDKGGRVERAAQSNMGQ